MRTLIARALLIALLSVVVASGLVAASEDGGADAAGTCDRATWTSLDDLDQGLQDDGSAGPELSRLVGDLESCLLEFRRTEEEELQAAELCIRRIERLSGIEQTRGCLPERNIERFDRLGCLPEGTIDSLSCDSPVDAPVPEASLEYMQAIADGAVYLAVRTGDPRLFETSIMQSLAASMDEGMISLASERALQPLLENTALLDQGQGALQVIIDGAEQLTPDPSAIPEDVLLVEPVGAEKRFPVDKASRVTTDPMSLQELMTLQQEVMRLNLQAETTAKAADKSAQGIQTLFKNQ